MNSATTRWSLIHDQDEIEEDDDPDQLIELILSCSPNLSLEQKQFIKMTI